MKITKVTGTLLVMLAVVSILTGCGKSKNDDSNIVTSSSAPINTVPTTSYPTTTNSGCSTISVAGDGSATFPVSGQATMYNTGFFSQTYIGGSGYSGGQYYYRVNASGDTIYLSFSGSTANATVRLAPITVAALGGSGNFCVAGVLFNNSGLTSNGLVYANIYLATNHGYLGM